MSRHETIFDIGAAEQEIERLKLERDQARTCLRLLATQLEDIRRHVERNHDLQEEVMADDFLDEDAP